MDRYSFVMVLLSIIVGLGVTELLTGVARQIQERKTTKFYWMHSLLVGLVFIALLQQWWESWDLRQIDNWSFLAMLLMLGGPIGLYVISHLLFPNEIENTDFKKHYFENTRATYLIAVLTVVLAAAYRPISFGDQIINEDNLASLVVIAVASTLSLAKKHWVHRVLVPILFGAVVLDILVFHPAI